MNTGLNGCFVLYLYLLSTFQNLGYQIQTRLPSTGVFRWKIFIEIRTKGLWKHSFVNCKVPQDQ